MYRYMLSSFSCIYDINFLVGGKHRSWCKRWFILSDNCLYYFKSPEVSLRWEVMLINTIIVIGQGTKRYYTTGELGSKGMS